jgi:hypothetical protein
MYYTIYKITNQIDGKFYIGSHKTKDLNDKYMGSGKYLKYAQEKYGIENFTKEILFVFDAPELMYAKEAELVNEEFLASENTYNIKVGGFGGWDYINSNETLRKEKNSRARISTNKVLFEKYNVTNPSQLDFVKNKMSLAAKKQYDLGITKLPSFKGRTHTEESKSKIGNKNSFHQKGDKNSQFGTIWITNGVSSKKIKKESAIPEGWRVGKIQKRV